MPNCSIGRYLIEALIGTFLAHSHNRERRTCSASTPENNAGDKESCRPATKPHALQDRWHPQEEEHHGIERKVWRITLILYALTFFATSAAAIFAYGAYGQAKRQADIAQKAFIASDRPWIKVIVSLSEGIGVDFTGGVGFIFLDYQVENVGHSPALDVRIGSWSFPGREWADDFFKSQRQNCQSLSGQPEINQEQKWTIFPGDKITWDRSKGTIIPGYKPEDITKIGVINNGRMQVPLTFSGCVDYVSGSDLKHHQTAFAFTVEQLITFQGDLTRNVYVDTSVAIPSRQLLLVKQPTPADQTN